MKLGSQKKVHCRELSLNWTDMESLRIRGGHESLCALRGIPRVILAKHGTGVAGVEWLIHPFFPVRTWNCSGFAWICNTWISRSSNHRISGPSDRSNLPRLRFSHPRLDEPSAIHPIDRRSGSLDCRVSGSSGEHRCPGVILYRWRSLFTGKGSPLFISRFFARLPLLFYCVGWVF